MPRMANVPVEQSAPTAQQRHARPWLLRAVPGALAALLFLALALGRGVLAGWAGPLQGALALALLASVMAQPRVAGLARSALASQRLPRAGAIAAVIALALALRTPGLAFGLPYFEHPDEWAVAEDALRMLRTGEFSPFSYTYPTLYVYLQVGVAAAHFLWGAGAGLYRAPADIDPALFYVWARALTALLGTGAVALTYVAGRMLYGHAAGLIAATLLAVMPAAAGDAHYVTTDTPAMFFSLLAFLAIARLGADAAVAGRRGDRETFALALLAGMGVGLATATKWNVGSLIIALAFACFFAAQRSTLNVQCSTFNGLCAALGVLLGFTLGVPFWLRDMPRILSDLAGIAIHYRFEGHPGAESSQPALFYWWALTREGTLLAWACLGGVLLAFVRRRRADTLVLAVVVPAVLQLTGVTVVFFRNAMPVLPFLCMLAAALVVPIADRLLVAVVDRRTRRHGAGEHSSGREQDPVPPFNAQRSTLNARIRAPLLAAIVALLAIEPFAQAIHDELLRSRPTTRILAGAWLAARTQDGDRIWLENNTLMLPQRLRAIGGEPAIRHDIAWYRDQGIRYIVVDLGRDTGAAALATFGEPAARFLRAGERHGPELAIFASGAPDIATEPRAPSGATLGAGAIILEGYRHGGVVSAGETLPLALFWRATRPPPANYTVYVHLVDAAGNRVAQRDVPPLEGRRPTSGWMVGELVRDDQDLPIPSTVAPGTYRLLVGMYDPATLVAINDAGPIDIGVVQVEG